MGGDEDKPMIVRSDSELEGFDPERYSNDKMSVSGQPVLGNVVEIAYNSRAGGSYNSPDGSTVRGELIYVSGFGSREEMRAVVHNPERGRSVALPLNPDKATGVELRSLAARKSTFGQRLGKVSSVEFTDERVNTLAPAMTAILAARSGDGLMVNGTEYGVVRAREYGPEEQPGKATATLTRPDGSEYELKANSYTGNVTFSVRYGDELDVDPESVSVSRFRARYWDHESEELDAPEVDTTDLFPAPHYAREGERLTFTLTREDGEDERVSGEVTDVRYFQQMGYTNVFSDPEVQDPETTVELDDGRKVRLKNASEHGSWVTRSRREKMDDHGVVRAFVITHTEGDADNEYEHIHAVDFQSGDGGEDDPEDTATDGGSVLMADGGVSPDELAREVGDTFASSDLPLDAISVHVDEDRGEVTVKANGFTSREDWTQLRAEITGILEMNGFAYRAKDAWAFVEVTGRNVEADGGVVAAGPGPIQPDGGSVQDPHREAKVKVINSPIVWGARTAGPAGKFLAVKREGDADGEELDRYHLVMELNGYVDVDPSVLDRAPRMVSGEDLTLDLWLPKDARSGGEGDE